MAIITKCVLDMPFLAVLGHGMTERNNHVFVIVSHAAFSQAKGYNNDKLSLSEHLQFATGSIYIVNLRRFSILPTAVY